MSKEYADIPDRAKGAWVIHHGRKTVTTQGGGAAFPTIDTAGRSAALLSSLAATNETTLQEVHVNALAANAGLNSKLELPAILQLLKKKRLIDVAANGSVAVVGLTTAATSGHAAEIFEDLEPTNQERATILAAEFTTDSPQEIARLAEFVGDQFSFTKVDSLNLVESSARIGFVDAEGDGNERLVFNGNLFRRDNVEKVKRILDGLSTAETTKISEIETLLDSGGCIALTKVETVLGPTLLSKLRAAGMYDIQFVHNKQGDFGFVTRPSAFHKYQDPMADDSFDLAKALVAALYYGMNQSSAARGKITMLRALLNKLIRGESVGPATAIGQDYKVLEEAGVLRTWRDRYGFSMELRKIDIGEMALKVLTQGDASADSVASSSLIGKMEAYTNPEASRWDFRQKTKKGVGGGQRDFLETLRTKGPF
jgi:hypothetical protein